MPEKISLKSAFNLPPEKAVEYFESKGYKITFDWRDMQREAHTKAFTVAGVTKADVLEDLRNALLESEKQGLSYGQFKSLIIPALQKKGWYGKREVSRPDGSVKEVDLSLPHRLRTIFNTNMRTSMMAGRYRQMKDTASRRPYWRYVAVMDGRTREAHRLLNGKIFRHDDPFWDSHFPPNGWGCRCRVVSISKEEFREKNYGLSNGEILKKAVPVAPEWGYNPGKRDWKPDIGRYSPEIRTKLKKELESLNSIAKSATRPEKPSVEHDWKREVRQLLRNEPKEISKEKLVSAGILKADTPKDAEIPKVYHLGKIPKPGSISNGLKALSEFDELIVKEPAENAIIISKEGRVYCATGNQDEVNINLLSKDFLKGCYINHNHPEKVTEFNLSYDDIRFLVKYDLKVVKGVDYKYEYWATKGRTVEDEKLLEQYLKASWRDMDEEKSNFLEMLRFCKTMSVSLIRRARDK